MLRSLSDDYIQAIVATRFWDGIRADRELFPEIRDEAVTIYYGGAALIRDLRLSNGTFSGTTHAKYVPLSQPNIKVEFASNGGNLFFAKSVEALPLGNGNADTLRAYKIRMKLIGGTENKLIHAICCYPGNVIIDQEIKFRTSNSDVTDKINFLSFDPVASAYSFAEVKEISDKRLRAAGNGPREVARQLKLFGERVQAHAESISSAIDRIVTLKSRLGLVERITPCLGKPTNRLLSKPILVISGCREQDVENILMRRDEWKSLLDCLEPVAAGLILCGIDGTRLDLAEGTQRQWFDRGFVK